MKTRRLGKTNLKISEVGYGGWGIGAKWWGPTDDAESKESLQAAWNAGVNFFDTAYVYGDGHSEKLIGQVLKGKPAVFATKIPPKNQEWPPKKGSKASAAFPAEWIQSCTERSLKYLQRETIELTQFHVWRDEWLQEDEWKNAVAKLKAQGKIKSFGVSINDHAPNSALELVASGLADTVQVIFNIFDQTPVEKLFPLCKKNDVGVIARVPFDEGGLTGAFTKDTRFEKGDFRGQYFRGDHLTQTLERVENLKKFVGNGVKTMPELALKFILAHEEVAVVIPGMRKPAHVAANTAVSETAPLSPSLKAELHKHAWPRNFYGWWN